MESDCLESLKAFGFTELEARAYVFLLGESPSTGYRVAQAIDKPAANTYKALESLRNKGAVVGEAGDGKLCRAVPAEEMLGQLERRFREHQRRAGSALARVQGGTDDQHVYQLRTPAQVMERCRRMLSDCRRIAIVDAFPLTLDSLRPAIQEKVARGVAVAVKAYRPIKVPGAHVVLQPHGEEVLQRWPGQWLNLVTDGRQHLLAFLSEDGSGVHQAVWSGSTYLAWVYHSAVGAEVVLSALQLLVEEGASVTAMRRALRRYQFLFNTEIPGYQELFRRFGGPRRAEPQKILK
ncbi:MAG TPA: helix-turn-helix domain-containing protein [Gemmataceae bacterium]|nr:helix-turn-helix domain-containing protein [Gemmataceae bacterium]